MVQTFPKGRSKDGTYWLDLPVDKVSKEKVQKVDLQSSETYLHVKPMFGGTFTDIVIWVFYPFNGPARAKIEFFNVKLGRIREHVGDWEHLTLRISNFTGELWSVYFSKHSTGIWVNSSKLEFHDELKKIEKVLPGKLKSAFKRIVHGLPKEVLEQEGLVGPKMKRSWKGDEKFEG
ncbi:Vacuolar protein sorting-associated protein 62 [Macleaya cordata]|uniref:Vacuolar protein sorting-associated protein 62 n=1 Tax=Macleaya cordata TaxID=56857 RepID=A0A200Q450_MACCD|nr:Vacuolar protein sorting-associated protein 62 [Macleaya cordata]